MQVFGRFMRRAGRTKVFARLASRVAAPVDRLLHRVSGGRLHVSESFTPTLMLTAIGRRSGLERQTPLLFVRDGPDYVVAASNFGREHHPAWSTNLLANPEAWVEVKGRREPVRAALVDAPDMATLWPRLVEVWPGYADYDARTTRNIRLFRLTPR